MLSVYLTAMIYAAKPLPASSQDAEPGRVAKKPVLPSDRKNYEMEGEHRHKQRSSLLYMIRGWLRRSLRQRHDSLKEVLEEVIEEHEEQAQEPLPPEEKIMLHNMLGFADIKVSDIMVPRAEIAAVPGNITLDELIRHIIEIRHTRVPVYEETPDHMLGFIHLKDMLPLLSGSSEFDIKKLLRPLLFVPPSMRIIDLLINMRHMGSHMAMVVDEYGGTDGLVTMEDLFEEIVGDIQDEHDGDEDKKDRIVQINDTTFEVDASILIEKLEKKLGITLVAEENSGEFDTLGGFIFFQLGRVPTRGEIVRHESGARFEVLDADPRRIGKVRIRMG
jgi:magnesium and cobalt transporter